MQQLYETVDRSMEKLTELRMHLKLRQLPSSVTATSVAAAAATDEMVNALASDLSNSLTCALVDLRGMLRRQQQNNRNDGGFDQKAPSSSSIDVSTASHTVSCACAGCITTSGGGGGAVTATAACVHRAALADRVIDRAFDEHKNMLRESLKEARAELELFRSGGMVKQLQRKIDDLELRLKQQQPQQAEARNVAVKATFEPRAAAAAVATAAPLDLGGVDAMIAAFKQRCEERHDTRAQQEQQKQQATAAQQQQQQQLQQKAVAAGSLYAQVQFETAIRSTVESYDACVSRKVDLFMQSCCSVQNRSVSQWQRHADDLAKRAAALSAERDALLRRLEAAETAAAAAVTTATPAPPPAAAAASATGFGRRASNNASGKVLDVKQKPLHPAPLSARSASGTRHQ